MRSAYLTDIKNTGALTNSMSKQPGVDAKFDGKTDAHENNDERLSMV